MFYKRFDSNGYLVAVGIGEDGIEITEEEYNALLILIHSKPDAPEGYEYRITEAGEYVLVELPPMPEPEPDEALTRYANELTGENDLDLVSATETLITKFTEE